MEFIFNFTPSKNVPRDFVYRKSRPADEAVAVSPQTFMAASHQETLQWLGSRAVTEHCDAAVIITDLDDGSAEWRVELRRNQLAPAEPSAQDRMHVAHGHVESSAVFDSATNHRGFAKHMMKMALSAHNLSK